jgi:hypothetical protein
LATCSVQEDANINTEQVAVEPYIGTLRASWACKT